MIHYSLTCAADHDFDGWFRSSDDFEAQAARHLVTCPVCGSAEVRRGLMAPAVATRREPAATPPVPVAAADVPGSVAAAPSFAAAPALAADPRAVAMMEMVRAIRREVEAKADYVGTRFPEEARRIHYGEAEARGIYGEASPTEVEALREEGVDVLPLPHLPDEQN
ncbi:DUF1178 family protein [Pseudoxanthobacter sp.]|uniref:DUF1178 family protein n=1 Tax=Pseudoxanthobacter sp. TaxID=1925742 RepID=UPI002FDF8FDF